MGPGGRRGRIPAWVALGLAHDLNYDLLLLGFPPNSPDSTKCIRPVPSRVATMSQTVPCQVSQIHELKVSSVAFPPSP